MMTKFSKLQLEQIKELFNKKLGSRKIAKIMNVNRSTITRAYKQLNLNSASVKTPRFAYLAVEKKCKICKNIKSINHFRQRIRGSRISYETYCLTCEYIVNKEKLKQRAKKLRKSDARFCIRRSVSYSIWKMLKCNNSKKDKSCLKYLDYSIDELKEYLEKQFDYWMSWKNYGAYNAKVWNDEDPTTWTWQIDHIIPQSMLPYKSMKEDNFKKCWSLNNLRPLSSKQNLLEGINKIRHIE